MTVVSFVVVDLVCPEVGPVPASTLCKALQWGTSISLIDKLTNQFNEMWST